MSDAGSVLELGALGDRGTDRFTTIHTNRRCAAKDAGSAPWAAPFATR